MMACACVSPVGLFAQTTANPVKFSKEYAAQDEIRMFSNSSFRLVYYVNTGEVNTYKDRNVTTLKDVQKIALNPTGNSVALLHGGHLKVYSFEEANKKLFDVVHKPQNKKLKRRPVALAFSSDATKLLVSYSDGEILVCNTKTYQPDFSLQNGLGISSALAMSANGYFIASKDNCRWMVLVSTFQISTVLPVAAAIKYSLGLISISVAALCPCKENCNSYCLVSKT